GYAEAVRELQVDEGTTAAVEVALRRAAVLRIRLLETERSSANGNSITILDAAGREISCEIAVETSGEENWVTLSGVPRGGGWVVVDTNFLRLSVEEGSHSEIVFPLRRPRTVVVRWRAPTPTLPDRAWRWAAHRFLAEGRIPFPEMGSFRGAEEGGWSE